METKFDFSDVLITPKSSFLKSRSEVDLSVYCSFKFSRLTLSCIPLMAANMDTVGTIDVMKELCKEKMFTCLHKFLDVKCIKANAEFLESNVDFFAFSIGFDNKEIEKLKQFASIVNFKVICIDVANGYMDGFVAFCNRVRQQFPEKIIIAGNVCTSEGVYNLIVKGKVDVVKCGIGSGSACTTRLKTGIGCPQFSCVQECQAMAHYHGAKIISDGGITCPGDVAKAFGIGADFVMMGGQLAGHKECPGDFLIEDGKRFKTFYGMSSSHAMNRNYSKMKSYRTSEGRFLKVAYKGPIANTVADFLGGLRSTCTYTNFQRLSDLIGNLNFVKVNNQFNRSLSGYQ